MAESALPFPTKTRLKLADAIAAGRVRHYPFQTPQTFNDINGQLVTAKVQLLLAAGLVEVPEPTDHNYSIVRLTPEGMAWVTRARTSKISTEGPGSTSPEPGPYCPHGGERTRSCAKCASLLPAESTKDGT